MQEPLMNSRRVLSLVSVAAALCASGVSAQAMEYGTVVSSTPVIGQTSVPQRECYDEQVAVQQQRSGGGGAIVGAVIGGLVGNSVGAGAGRAAATALGAVTGAAIGDRAEAGSQQPAVRNVQRCRTTTSTQENIIGYDVVYDYAGARRSARLAQNPGGPGTQIALDVNVAPSGSTTRSGRGQAVPQAGYGAPVGQPAYPTYDDGNRAPQTVYYEDRRPVYYEPAPVYYSPYPAVVAAPTIWIGGSWGYRHHRRW
jgi:uncharacterized protein YcfJ